MSYNNVCYLVEANSFEKLTLWNTWVKSAKEPIKWKDSNRGVIPVVGLVNKLPVCVSILINEIEGMPVVFWEATSRMVDHDLIKDWFKEKMPQLFPEQNAHLSCDAQNFHCCVHYLQDMDSTKFKTKDKLEIF